jgi:Lar family restriction alleviation protein
MHDVLRPCPFCGSRDLQVRDRKSVGYVLCSRCGASGPFVERPLVRSSWNRRVSWEAVAPVAELRTEDDGDADPA